MTARPRAPSMLAMLLACARNGQPMRYIRTADGTEILEPCAETGLTEASPAGPVTELPPEVTALASHIRARRAASSRS